VNHLEKFPVFNYAHGTTTIKANLTTVRDAKPWVLDFSVTQQRFAKPLDRQATEYLLNYIRGNFVLAKIQRGIVLCFICALVMSGSLLSATAAQAKPFKRTASGWLTRTGVDIDGNGLSLSSITTFGKGTFGQSASNEVSEIGTFAGEFCEFFPPDIVILRLPIISRSSIMRFANGDLLFATLATDGAQSSLCVDVNSPKNESEVHLVITGGTGKFAGATGTLLMKVESTVVLREADFPVHVAITQETTGDISLVRRRNDADSDSDSDSCPLVPKSGHSARLAAKGC
jgi:hypothetical protein